MFQSRTFQILTVLISLAGLILHSNAHAFEDSVAIPASACSPVNEVQAESVYLQAGSWAFTDNSVGTVVLNCPVPRNAFRPPETSPLYIVGIEGYRVFFSDSDAAGTNSVLRVRLCARTAGRGLHLVGQMWVSSPSTPKHQIQFVPTPHIVEVDALYFFQVQMSRSTTSERVLFAGIDFAHRAYIP